ncbi:MAG: Kelch repeat type 2-containing protein [Bacteroidetes bacterium]|nr:MAG: Kelch repeat type 2-containing protein [Bacteroidota bacterium]
MPVNGKSAVLLFIQFLLTWNAYGQFNQWTWMHGDNTPSQPGVYGTQGVAAPGNKPPGRYEAAQWKDQQGNFWMYGGGSGVLRYCDLWKYDPLTNMWTWMHGSSLTNQAAVYGVQGVSAPANTPGGIGFAACTWTDVNGNLWMFGGDDGTNAPFDNLWKYDPLINEWTWIKGTGTPGPAPVHGVQGVAAPANTPGARVESSCTWTDNAGNLWMFGGTTSGVGVSFNDLWKYDPLTNMWTWMKGSNFANQPGVYGALGTAAPANTPGSRWCYTSWKDNGGNLWLFGGTDALSPIGMNFFNDLWKYDIVSNQWAWMSGSNQPNQSGVYGTLCTPSPANVPGGRAETRSCWTDSCGNFWLLGGRDLGFNLFNDLWRYNLATGLWTWVSGDNTPNQPGVYGTITVPSPTNKPGGRMGAVSWINASGLWLFGGYDFSGGEHNDLWLYTPDTVSVSVQAQPLSGCVPLSVNFSVTIQQGCSSVKDYSWNFGDPASGTADTSSLAQPAHVYNSAGSYTVTLIAHDCQGRADTLQTVVTASPGFTLSTISTPSGCLTAGGTATANTSGGTSPFVYLWQPSGNTNASATGLLPGTYTVTVTDASNCSAIDSVVVGLNSSGFDVNLGNDSTVCGPVNFVLDAGQAGSGYTWSTGEVTQLISVSDTGLYWVQISTGICSDADSIHIAAVLPPALNGSGSFCEQPVITLQAGNQNGVSYLWSTGDTTSSISISQPGLYTVIVSSGNCIFSDSISVSEAAGGGPWFPNAFTPNGNNLNEVFRPEGEAISDYHLSIFNRWGELIFETGDFAQGWNGFYKGRLVQEDVYVWIADYKTACEGTGISRRIGHVSVIR